MDIDFSLVICNLLRLWLVERMCLKINKQTDEVSNKFRLLPDLEQKRM